MNKIAIILIIVFGVTTSYSQDQSIPYTLADRDRLIQVEANVNGMRNEMNSLRNEMNSLRNEMNSLRNEMNSLRSEIDAKLESINSRFDGIQIQFDGINQRLDSQQTFLFWGFGLLFTFMIFMLGFILWDRRTTLAPVKIEVEHLKQTDEQIIEVIRKHSEFHPKLRELLKVAGML
ncbi:MAG: hypothetical protein U9R19_18030 [Bacteroidota bacterium]|nr:hypothetical protein [Bacteroidota bacterium]